MVIRVKRTLASDLAFILSSVINNDSQVSVERAVRQGAEASSHPGSRPPAQSSFQVPSALTIAEASRDPEARPPPNCPDSRLQQLYKMMHVVCFKPREGTICYTTDS